MKSPEAVFAWVYLRSQPWLTFLWMCSILAKARSVWGMYMLASTMPLLIWVARLASPSKPRFQLYWRLFGLGYSVLCHCIVCWLVVKGVI